MLWNKEEMKEKKEEEYLKDYSARNPLLPFD